jgi:Zn-dependent peptidase ImmA (M78 family)
VSKTATKKKLIQSFSKHLKKKKVSLSPEKMADEFLSFFYNQNPPTSHYWIDYFCSEVGIDEIEYKSFPDNIRGFHAITPDGKITIILEQSPTYAGKVHTLYHELYEIICELMDNPALKTEHKANLFSASVIMPEKHFFEYVIRRGLMFSEIKTYYSEIATDSILLRINHLFRKRGLFHIAYFLKNSNAYKRASAEDHKCMADFSLHLSTLDRLDSINNEGFTQRIIEETVQRLRQLPADEISLIKFDRSKKTVLAEPILLDWNGAIKEIAIQIIDGEVYQNLSNLLRRENESSTLCESVIRKTG